MRNHVSTVKLLLENGIDTSAKAKVTDEDGKITYHTALDIAKGMGNKEIIELLRR